MCAGAVLGLFVLTLLGEQGHGDLPVLALQALTQAATHPKPAGAEGGLYLFGFGGHGLEACCEL
jgi:hypothetical protein